MREGWHFASADECSCIYSEQQNCSSVGHFHKDCFVVLETLGLNS